LKRVSNLIKKNQWLWCWEQTWYNIVDTFNTIMSKSKYYWWSDNNYTKKLVTESLSQIANIFYAKKKKFQVYGVVRVHN